MLHMLTFRSDFILSLKKHENQLNVQRKLADLKNDRALQIHSIPKHRLDDENQLWKSSKLLLKQKELM